MPPTDRVVSPWSYVRHERGVPTEDHLVNMLTMVRVYTSIETPQKVPKKEIHRPDWTYILSLD